MIKNLKANLPAMNFLFTHFDNLDIDMGSLIKGVNRSLNHEEH